MIKETKQTDIAQLIRSEVGRPEHSTKEQAREAYFKLIQDKYKIVDISNRLESDAYKSLLKAPTIKFILEYLELPNG